MYRMNWKKNAVHTAEITGYTAEGMGVARLEGRVVFVPGTIRGERWTVRLEKVTKNVAWARGVELLEGSPERREPDCPLAGRCGGCQFRHMTYAEELRAKGQRVADALERVGGVKLDWPPVLGAERPERYRNKVQFPVAQEKRGLAIGYYRPRSHDVLDAPDCLLQPLTVTALRGAVKEWMERYQVPAYGEEDGAGLIRHLYVRTNSRDQALCCLVVNGTGLPFQQELVDALRRVCPGLAGVVLNFNTRDTNVILGEEYRTLWGRDYLEEELCGLTFRLSVPSFSRSTGPRPSGCIRWPWTLPGCTGTRRCWTCTAASGPSPWPWPGRRGGSSGRRWCPRPLRMPNRMPPGRISRMQSFSAAMPERWPKSWPMKESAPGSSAWTRPERAWDRRSPPSWPPWPRSASSTSPATPLPWPGT